MSPKTPILPRDFEAYRKRVTRSNDTFDCPMCGKLLLPKQYEKHCAELHRINVKHTCVWCREVSWSERKKIEHAPHLYVCYENFMESQNSTKGLRPLNLKHEFRQQTLYDFSTLPTFEEHDSVWPLKADPVPISFRDENLNLAASYVSKFIRLRNTHDWFHVMVRAVAFDSFLSAVDDDRGNTRTLAFSCWCNGGVYERPEHRQHRHLIVVSPRDRFEKRVWSKVKISKEDKPNRNFKCKTFKRIDSLLHLVNTLGYLSHRKSRCRFTFQEAKMTTPFGMQHFYLYRTLPVCYKLPLVLLWDNGIHELLRQEKFQYVSLPKLIKRPLKYVDGRWKQKIGDFYGIERGLILPVSKRFVATERQTTPFYLHLMNGEKLYFESDAKNESLDNKTWLKRQAENGNVFYEAVEDEWWTPRQRDQKNLNIHVPLLRRNKELETEKECLKRKLNVSEEENRSKQLKIDTLVEENVKLKSENKQLKNERLKL